MAPPELPGFEYVRLLGSGGYADVFLYHQQMPSRPVAIKVLLTEAFGQEDRNRFFAEANAMASVSTHPYIVSVFHAEVAASGHPYLVMEYYPRENFSVRARAEQIPVSEVLRVGVQVASAVETAHRAGVLHRDIKPANILTSEYDRPGLTDFGIATAVGDGTEAEGMSIPWSPPEVINGSAPGDATADVYSLTATLHTLLSGRSPFEVPGGSNRTFDLIPRIEAGGPQPTGRREVPESLERLLRHGMSKVASDRPASPLELARMLQAVEVEQGWAATQIEVAQDPRDVRARNAPDDDGTRLKGPTVIQSQPDTGSGPPPLVSGVPGASSRAANRGDVGNEGTVARGSVPPGAATPLIGGVGARPVGLAGAAAPRPVAPMPSAHGGGDRSFDASSYQDAGGADGRLGGLISGGTGDSSGAKRQVNWVMVAASSVAAVVVLVGLGLAFSTGSTTTTEPPPPPTPTAGPPPSEVAVPEAMAAAAKAGGVVSVTWTHRGEPSEFEYRILGANDDVLGEVNGEQASQGGQAFAATITTDDNCFRVVAIRLSDGEQSSDDQRCVQVR